MRLLHQLHQLHLKNRECTLWRQRTSRSPLMTDLIARARAYVAKMPPAIAGQHGHDATFKVALALIHGFGLSEEDAMPIIEEYSNRCAPPWSHKELEHKLDSAAQHARSGKPRGHLRAAQHRPAPVEPPLPVRPKKKISLCLRAEASQPVEEKTAGSATKSSPGPDPRAAARSGFPAVAPRLAGGRPEVSAPSRTTASESHTPQLARGDEIEARRIAGELDRLHRDGAIASKNARDPDAVFYARLLRDFGATCTGRSGSRQNAPKILPDGEFAPRPGAENQWKVPDPPPGLNWAERQKFYMDDLRDAIGDEWITAPPGCPATGVLMVRRLRTAEMTRAGKFGR